MPKLDRDKLQNADRKPVANAAMGVVDGVQRFPIEHRILGMAAAFIIMCRELGIEASDAFTAASNIMIFRDSGNTTPEFLAVGDYIRNET